MDYADEDAVIRYERWENALMQLAYDGTPIALYAQSMLGASSIAALKREALINVARVDSDEHLPRVQKAFPGIDLVALVHALRVKYVELRLGGE